jgi:hypothetical protein
MRRFVDSLLVALVIVACWQCLNWAVGNNSLSSPWSTVVALVQMLGTAAFWGNVGETARALAYALVIALAGGVALGVLLGANRMSGVVAEPILLNLYSLPKVTLYPLVLLVFGLGLSAKVAFGGMHGLIPILMFTMNAIRDTRDATGLPSRIENHAPVVCPHDCLRRAAGDLSRSRVRPAARLLADLAGRVDRRNVRVATRARLSADECDEPWRYPHDHGGRPVSHSVCPFV